MHRLTREALNTLKNEKIVVSVDDAIFLEELALKTDKISDQKLLEHSGKYCGNTEIFPLTIGARVWLKTDAKEWFENDLEAFNLAVFYAMGHSRYPDKFIFKNAKQCRKVVYKWAKTISATEEELYKLSANSDNVNNIEPITILIDLYEQVISHPSKLNLVPLINFKKQHLDETMVNKDEGTTPIIAWLIANCGESADYWLWGKSWDNINALINSVIHQQTDTEQIDNNDPSILSMIQFNKHISKIRKNDGK